jgi:uncharacterized protein YukE
VDEFFGIDKIEARRISGQLRSAESVTQGGLPKLLAADEQASQGITNLINGSAAFEQGLGDIQTARNQHIEDALNTIRSALQALPAAMQGRPSQALENTLTIWNSGVTQVDGDLETIVSLGNQVKTTIDSARDQFTKLQQATQDLQNNLSKMIAALGETQGNLDRHIAQVEGVEASGASSLNTFGS